MTKKPMPKGNALSSNKTHAKPAPTGKVQVPASRHQMPKGGTARGKK